MVGLLAESGTEADGVPFQVSIMCFQPELAVT